MPGTSSRTHASRNGLNHSEFAHQRGRLGLSVARSIIWEHSGDIRLANRRAGGLHVRVDLPGPEQHIPTDTEHAECGHSKTAKGRKRTQITGGTVTPRPVVSDEVYLRFPLVDQIGQRRVEQPDLQRTTRSQVS